MTVCVQRIELFLYRASVAEPIKTSFGTIAQRTTMLIRVTDADGAIGWGEIWCSIPAWSAENKISILEGLVAPMVLGVQFSSASECWHSLSGRLHRIALQCGEQGPVGACLAGLDLALWDMEARRAGVPLAQLLGGVSPGAVPAYASGLNPDTASDTVHAARAAGFSAFKVKVAFGMESDRASLARLASVLRPDERLLVDANGGWEIAEARRAMAMLAPHNLVWIEEPILASSPPAEWAELAILANAPLAGGENVSGFVAFADMIAAGHHRIVQPDLLKWGGVTANAAVARRVVAAGLSYCPHWLGSGIGLLAAAQMLAAAGGPGLLEFDVMENPLREVFTGPLPPVRDGLFTLPQGPGLGVEPSMEAALGWLVHQQEMVA